MREQEQHELPHALVSRKPESEKGKHPGEKARLGDAEQEAQDIEARRGPREAEREGDKPPRPDDPREPDSRSHAIEDQIARNLEDAIAEKEQRRPKSIRSEEHTSELQSLMRISYAVFCLKKKTQVPPQTNNPRISYKLILQTHKKTLQTHNQTYRQIT